MSAPHQFITSVLGWRAPVFDAEGRSSEMPEYGHAYGEYVAAFARAGLAVRVCREPTLSDAQACWNPAGQPTAEDRALVQALAVSVWEVERP